MIQHNRNTVNGRVSVSLYFCFATCRRYRMILGDANKEKEAGWRNADTKNAMDFDKTLPLQTTRERLKKEDGSIRKKVSIFALRLTIFPLFYQKRCSFLSRFYIYPLLESSNRQNDAVVGENR